MEPLHGMDTSGFWEGRIDESQFEEKYSQVVSRSSSSLGQALSIVLLRLRVVP